MNRYQQGKIYKICNSVDDQIYVGSTCKRTLAERMAQHRAVFKQGKTFRIYQHFRSIGVDNFYIELLEAYPCNSRDELIAREGYWMRRLNATLNEKVPGRTQEQYRNENRPFLRQIAKQYRQKNKSSIEIKKKTPMICDCGSQIQIDYKSGHYRSQKHQFYMQFGGLNSINV